MGNQQTKKVFVKAEPLKPKMHQNADETGSKSTKLFLLLLLIVIK